MESRKLDDLDPRFQPIAEQLLKMGDDAGLDLRVITTLRDLKSQEEKVKGGFSWTMKSKHLPQPPYGKSWAIDVAPVHCMKLKDWGPSDPAWVELGRIGESLGLKWGVVKKRKDGTTQRVDLGHFEWHPEEAAAPTILPVR